MHNYLLTIGLTAFVLWGCSGVAASEGEPAAAVDGAQIRIEFNDAMHSRVVAKVGDEEVTLGRFAPSEYVYVNGTVIHDFAFEGVTRASIHDEIGSGSRYVLTGVAEDLRKLVDVTLYDDFPTLALFRVTYTNIGEAETLLSRWVNNHYQFTARQDGGDAFWSYQSESTSRRADWVLPVNAGFEQANFMGMNNSDYGGGTPISNLWRPDVGLAVGHSELVPRLVSLPVSMANRREAEVAVRYDREIVLAPQESWETYTTFANVHAGDYFATLTTYRDLMIAQGFTFADVHDDSYAPQWCAWGYERQFTMDQVYNTLPMVRELGYHWVVLDDGWQTNVGDWQLDPDKYPDGRSDMQAFVRRVHDEGFRSKLWWAPLALHPDANLYSSRPDFLLLDENKEPVRISWWNSYYMCPAYQPVQEYHNGLVSEFIERWGYQGLKIDGQHLNAAPPCHNPAHNHEHPEESVEAMGAFFGGIQATALQAVPDALIEICPCGTAYAFHNMPFMTQAVASDPTSSWQVRHKGKTIKGLMGRSTPYFGDHVELSAAGSDFASAVGIGAVIGTKFTWPLGAGPDPETDLTPERHAEWARWAQIYRERELPRGEYLGELYDIGFDRPEAHAISRNGRIYFAFYADQRPGRAHDDLVHFRGSVELRGLESGRHYSVRDYANGLDLGEVHGPTARLHVNFDGFLLLEAIPQ